MEPCVLESDPIIFAASQTVSPEGSEPPSHTPVLATLTSLMNKRGNNHSWWMADMNITLTVNTAEVENKTNIGLREELIISLLLPSTSGFGDGTGYIIPEAIFDATLGRSPRRHRKQPRGYPVPAVKPDVICSLATAIT